MLLFLSMLLMGGLIGFVGAGGSGITITLMIVGFGIPAHTAFGVAMSVMGLTMISGTYSHIREGNVLKSLGWRIGLFGALGAFLGARAAAFIEEGYLVNLTAATLIISAILIYCRVFDVIKWHNPTKQASHNWVLCILFGLINGFISSLCGIGAAAFIQLGLMYIFNVSIYQTIGTTMLIIMPIAFLGGIGFYSAGYLDFKIFFLVLAGQTIGAYIGAKCTRLAPKLFLKILMVGLPLSGGLILLIK